MDPILATTYSCEATRYIAEYIYDRLNGRDVLSARSTRHFSDVGFSFHEKYVFENPTSFSIKLKGRFFFQVWMPDLRTSEYVLGEQRLRAEMKQEMDEVVGATAKALQAEIKRIVDFAQQFIGRVPKQVVFEPSFEVSTDGQYI